MNDIPAPRGPTAGALGLYRFAAVTLATIACADAAGAASARFADTAPQAGTQAGEHSGKQTGTDDAASREQARIAFANMGGVRNWRSEGPDRVFVQSRHGQWYRADLATRCSGLPFAHTIGFVFEPDGSLDRFSSIVVDGQECRFKSLVEVDRPAGAERSQTRTAQRAEDQNAATQKTGGEARRSTSSAGASGAADAGGAPQDARIPFAHLGGIENWRAIGDDTLYIEGRNGQWYRAELFGFCPGLRFENAIGFVTHPVGSFDEFSSIVVDGRECHLRSLTKSGAPNGETGAAPGSEHESQPER